MPRPPGSSREAKKDNGERGRGVFCKNCPFPSRALPIPEKTFLPVWPEGPRRCLKDGDPLPVKMVRNSSHQNDKKQQGARCIRSGYTVPPVRIFQVSHSGDPGSPGKPAEASSQKIPLALPDSIILPDKARWEKDGEFEALCASQRPNGGPLRPCPLRQRNLRASTAEIGAPSPSSIFSPTHAAAGARRTCLPARGDRGASAIAQGAPGRCLPPAASPRPARSPADAGYR